MTTIYLSEGGSAELFSYSGNISIKVTGSSHSPEISCTVSGLPAGFSVDPEQLAAFTARRAPGVALSSARREADVPIFTSGLHGWVTDGAPLTIIIKNTDVKSHDYDDLRGIPRPGHADLPAYVKNGAGFDMSGGGEFSGRMTAPITAAGGVVLQILRKMGITVSAHLLSVGGIDDVPFVGSGPFIDECTACRSHILPMINESAAHNAAALISDIKRDGNSVGGVVECAVCGLGVGMGGAGFGGIDGRIAYFEYAVPGVKGVEFGNGFASSRLTGRENNDRIVTDGVYAETESNRCGGVLGGMSTGSPIVFKVAFKPTPSISALQDTVDLTTMTPTRISINGRHDPCIAVRAVPVVEAMAALAVYDVLCGEESPQNNDDLCNMRSEIDRLDRKISELLRARFNVSKRIGEYKRNGNMPVTDKTRETELLKKIGSCGGDDAENNERIERVYGSILSESRKLQEGIICDGKSTH